MKARHVRARQYLAVSIGRRGEQKPRFIFA